MIKKLLILIINGVFLLCALFAFSACDAGIVNDIDEEICSDNMLTDLYKSGEININDIKNIAALRVGYVAIAESEGHKLEDYKKIDFVATIPEPLNDAEKNYIENNFKSKVDGEVSSFEIIGYYGKYNDYYVAELSYEIKDVLFDTGIYHIRVANVFLGYIGSDELFVCKAK